MGERWSRLGGYMDQLCREEISGCACLVYEGEAERFRRYCGLRDVERGLVPDGDTLYRIYSLTKLYTAVAILQLLEAGKLHMEDPVAEYLPEYRSLQVNEVAANGWNEVRKAKGPLQVGHLLTMTSGISYAYDNDGPTMRRTKEAVERFRREHEDFSTREYASLFADIPLAFEPGSHFLYGAGYDVLAAVIEVVSGELFGEYLRGHIWEPLGLKSTMFRLRDARDRENLCGMYGKQERGAGIGENSRGFVRVTNRDRFLQPESHFEEGGGGVLSTMDDYMRFLRMLAGGGALDGERILTEESVRRMGTNRLSEEQIREFPIPGYGYGCGVRVRLAADGLGPAGEFGWYGMSGSYALVDPVHELCFLYMQQMIPGRDKEIHPELRRRLYEDYFER